MDQGSHRAYSPEADDQPPRDHSVIHTDFSAHNFQKVVAIPGGPWDWQSEAASAPHIASEPRHLSLAAPWHLASHLNSNRVSVLGASVLAYSMAVLTGLNDIGAAFGTAATAMVFMAPALLFSHVAARQMARLAMTRRIWLFMPVFLFNVLLTLLSAALVGRGDLYPFLLSAAMGTIAWYAFSEAALERYCPRRYGLVGDWGLLTLPTDRRSLFRRLWPASNLDGLDAVVVASTLRADQSRRFTGLIQRAALKGIEILSVPAFCERMTGRTPQPALGPDPYLHTPAPIYLKLRRVGDIALALILLVPFGTIIAISALIIRLESPGPAIFRQTRVGQRRVRFVCYKLRSMRTDLAGAAFTAEVDPRITRFGAIIRKWRIDEMPQLFNVLRGEMSWIGPRPEAIPLAAEYRRSIPNYSYRYLVPPGITGWAAVHQGNVGEVEAARIKLEYDFYYIRNLSFWMDVLVVLKTIRTVLTGFGSR